MNKRLVTSLLQYFYAVVFIVSAITKLIEPGLFEITIINQGIISTREIAAYFARGIIIVELFLGLALLQPYYLKKIILPASMITLIGFTVILAVDIFIGKNDNCGCFGEVIKMSPIEAIVKNILLLVLGIFIFLKSEGKTTKFFVPIIVFFVSFIFVFSIAPFKSYDDLVFSKYTNFSNEERVDLTSGNKLVAIFFIDCDHCMEVASQIVAYENDNNKVDNLFILFAGEESDSVQSFINATQIDHLHSRISIEDFFELIGSAPPRFYWLQEGVIKEYWDDNFLSKIIHFQNEVNN